MKRASKIVLYVLGALVLIALGAAVAYWLLGGRTTPVIKQPASPQPDETSQSGGSDNTAETPANSCLSSELTLTVAPAVGGGTAGSNYYTITLKNGGHRTCSLFGYPGVALLNSDDQPVGRPAERMTQANALTIALAPGKSAIATLQVVNNNFGPGVCKKGASQLQVYPPNDTEPLTVKTSISTWCPGFAVGPVVSG